MAVSLVCCRRVSIASADEVQFILQQHPAAVLQALGFLEDSKEKIDAIDVRRSHL